MSIHELSFSDRYQSEVQSQEHGFTLPTGYRFSIPSGNGVKQGTITVVDRYNVLYARLQYENDKLNGVCEFEKRGVVVESISYKNDVKDGWNTFFENGTIMKWVLYENGIIKRLLYRDPDLQTFRREYDVNTNELIYIAEYDKDNQLNGYGFTVKNKKVVDYAQFSYGYKSLLFASFANGVMTQYSSLGNVIYEGGFLDEIQLHFPRSGRGTFYDDNGIKLYDGDWENGVRMGHGSSYRNGALVYDGLWKDDQPHGNGAVFTSEGEKWYEGDWYMGKLFISPRQYFDYEIFCVVDGTFVKSDGLGTRRSNYSYGEPTVVMKSSSNPPRGINHSVPDRVLELSAGCEPSSPNHTTKGQSGQSSGTNRIIRKAFVKPNNSIKHPPSPPGDQVKKELLLPPRPLVIRKGPPSPGPPKIIHQVSPREQPTRPRSPESPTSNGFNLNEKTVIRESVNNGTVPQHKKEDSLNEISHDSKPLKKRVDYSLNGKEVAGRSPSQQQQRHYVIEHERQQSPDGSVQLPFLNSDPSSSTMESGTTPESTLQSEREHKEETTPKDPTNQHEINHNPNGAVFIPDQQPIYPSPPVLDNQAIQVVIQSSLNNNQSEKPEQKPEQKPELQPEEKPEPEPEPEKTEDIAKRKRKLYMWVGCGLIAVVVFIILLLLPESKVGKNGGDVTITSFDEWSRINHKVKTVSFNSECCNEDGFEIMEFTDFPQLTTIKVGDYSLGKVRSLDISGLPNLNSISIGASSFASERRKVVKLENRWFSLRDCPKLSSVSIDSYSFSDYKFLQIQSTLRFLM